MKEAQAILAAVESSTNIVITAHKSPDGDSIGSSLGMLRFLRSLGKEAVVCHPDPCPNFLEWAKREDEIIDFESDADKVKLLLQNADLIFSLDYNGAGRLGEGMAELFKSSKATKVMIDHHLNPETSFDIVVSEPTIGSTSQLVFEWIAAINKLESIDAQMVEPLYLGIMTDTGSFRFDSVNARTHEVVAEMLRTGLNHTAIHENTFDGNRMDKLRLRGYAISEKLKIVERYGVAYITLTDEEMNRFNYIKGDTEGLVNTALSVEGVKMAAFFAEKDGKIKISFRSKGPAVNQLASDHFNGGGHKFAAGGISLEGMETTIDHFIKVLPDYVG
jgi:phosphoesterase RecJ-like protein